ncbi:hypothetical protein PFICI_14855 [Pestalotiopsis fici W106-1]|uniref:Zn(2)-C6 fungal-type domain-containing protein n=1 Tax=Pestalotiopsis fici (strain W106-1 / CGMCC3.15140) TaxID=1229662 RepID=W3WH67_PESFW|nr:uncharacterized protein PFICI_14855 [Pestalotiopsis fici W106-1]ETS73250.1 hypothetical protein PFICI_14855 [Pestalotiopsis fici W106-1]
MPDTPPYSPTASNAPGDGYRRKRIRLSLACNQCRKRKVRCDTTLPKCRNCILRNEHCETTDPRNPGKGPSLRTLAVKDGQDQSLHLETGRLEPNNTVVRTSPGAGTPPESSGNSDLSPRSQGMGVASRGKGPSWLERAYQENTASHENRQIPVSTPDLVVNTDETAHRVKYLGGSSVQCLCRFVDIHLAHKGLEPASSRFKHGMSQSEEIALALFPSLPDLPPPEELNSYLDCFFDRVWPLFPIVDRNVLQSDLDHLWDPRMAQLGPLSSRVSPSQVPSLVIIYAIISIGADEMNTRTSETSTRYLAAAYSLYAHLVATPYIASVQALTLMALALRGQVKDGQAWHLIGQAVRIAHSIGLHKPAIRRNHDGSGNGVTGDENTHPSLFGRIWWSLYSLEKLTQLESGRPSIIDDRDEDQAPSTCLPMSGSQSDYFTAWVSLARIMGQISEFIYSKRPASSLDLFTKLATLDTALVEWDRSLSDNLKLGQNVGAIREEVNSQQHLASFLSLQFYYAHITLLRPAVIFPHSSYRTELSRHVAVLPSYSRIVNGAAICASAARATVTQMLNLADQGVRSVILGATPLYLAAVVLALSILRQPARRLARADLELLNLATEQVEDYFSRWIPNKEFIRGCSLLREQVSVAFHQFSAEPRLGATQKARDSSTVPMDRPDDADAAISNTVQAQPDDWPEELFEGLQFDELWDIMGSDFLMGNGQISI